MSIKDNYSFGEFQDAFWDAGRGDYYTYGGLETIFDMLDEMGVEDIDPVAICCDFTEYDDPLATAEELGIDVYDIMKKEDFNWDPIIVRQVCDNNEIDEEDFFSDDYVDWDDALTQEYCEIAGISMLDFMRSNEKIYDDDVWEVILDSGQFNDARMTSSSTLMVCE